MDALEMRLSLTADYLKRESSTAVEELMAAAFHAVRTPAAGAGELDRRGEGPSSLPPSGGDPRSAHPSIIKEQRRTRFHEELRTLLEKEGRGNIEGPALRRIAELTELFQGEQDAQIWWERAALQGDTVAVMMLADN
ncbi:hypothetical protein PV721_32425 [Streptomyces sp. MB09-01]|uniref:hypothetical protein n=1 Tax=Streptomyces sp. MB09-01 TaxID=3028666 RepID=UPI0029AA0D26|nr:hypothetical protein [Streptomyces sp. MB09-01]MDX3538961.1 hypothetical protein [Streptomyces sp. MB09-01]